jgi:hypothetical protein
MALLASSRSSNVDFGEPVEFDQRMSMLPEPELSEREKKTSAFSHRNYLPSLKKAIQLLEETDHSKCTPSLFFLSDGKASDCSLLYKGDSLSSKQFMKDLMNAMETAFNLMNAMETAFNQFSNRLTVVACGYGNSEFDIMKAIIEKAAACNAKNAKFLQTSLDPDALSKTISSIISSITETRTMLSRLVCNERSYHRIRINSLKENPMPRMSFLLSKGEIENWRVYSNVITLNPPFNSYQSEVCGC